MAQNSFFAGRRRRGRSRTKIVYVPGRSRRRRRSNFSGVNLNYGSQPPSLMGNLDHVGSSAVGKLTNLKNYLPLLVAMSGLPIPPWMMVAGGVVFKSDALIGFGLIPLVTKFLKDYQSKRGGVPSATSTAMDKLFAGVPRQAQSFAGVNMNQFSSARPTMMAGNAPGSGFDV